MFADESNNKYLEKNYIKWVLRLNISECFSFPFYIKNWENFLFSLKKERKKSIANGITLMKV